MKQTTIQDFDNCPAIVIAQAMSGYGEEDGFTSGLKRLPECKDKEMTLLGHGKNNADGVQLALFTPDGETVYGFNATPFCVKNGCFTSKDKSDFLNENRGTNWLVTCHYSEDGTKTVDVQEIEEQPASRNNRGRRS